MRWSGLDSEIRPMSAPDAMGAHLAGNLALQHIEDYSQ